MGDFTLDTTAHYMVNARTLIHLAVAAYEEDPADHASFKKTVFDSATLFSNAKTDTFGFIAADANNLVIAFRGTDSIKDWLATNFDFRVRKESFGKVHLGFAKALDSVWDAITARITKLQDNEQTIWVTGHSLGGALACLANRRLAVAQQPFAACTFGQPRVGNTSFADGYKRTLYRFVNNNDIVPTVPPRFVPLFPPVIYTHVGELQFFDKDGHLTEGSETSEPLGLDPLVMSALHPLSDDEESASDFIREGFKDHDRKNYIRLVEANQPQ